VFVTYAPAPVIPPADWDTEHREFGERERQAEDERRL